VRHQATGFQNGKEVVGGGFQNFLRADEIETFATRHPARFPLILLPLPPNSAFFDLPC
jgi:hypothetical protein